jgi:segregation and condensation protein A
LDLSAVESSLAVEDFLVIDIDRFQGPLDLLLHLIRTQDVDVFDIPISTITQQFLLVVADIQAKDLDNAGEFLEMAAALIRIKAQMLLPRHSEDEDEDPRAELVRRLLEYEQIREISDRLRRAEADRARRFGKGFVEARPRPALEEVPLQTTWDDLFTAALGVEEPLPRIHEHRVTTRPVAMEDKMNLILGTLKSVKRIEFTRLVQPFKNRMHGVMTFLAGLELTRRGRVILRQVRPFSELWVYGRKQNEGDVSKDGAHKTIRREGQD